MQTVLLTSIPPVANNAQFEERISYQRRCIRSWIATGHLPKSLNPEHEIADLVQLFPEVDFHPAYRSTAPINHRPLVYVSDLIALGLEDSSERLAICNADVFFEPLVPFTSGLPNELPIAYSNRVDIERFAEVRTRKTFYGIDYVNMSKAFAIDLPDCVFALGLPWWDYWLPLEAIRKGIIPFNLKWDTAPLLHHLIHGDRWDPASLVYLGRHLINLTSLGFDASNTNLYEFQINWQIFNEQFVGERVNPTAQIFARIARDLCSHISENSAMHDFKPQ